MTESVRVAVELGGNTVPAGMMLVETGRALSSTFTYDPAYLASRGSYPLDPNLPLQAGANHQPGLPGTFADAAPDRWGRNLIRRRLTREGVGRSRQLTDLDYLLGVSDHTRQGALRFSRHLDGPYLSERADVPRMIALPRLIRAADQVARSQGTDEDIRALLDAGTGSLGGARPKASVADDAGNLYIAKFPHHQDEWDVMAWEASALDLADLAGIRTPTRKLVRLTEGTVLLLDRFDRDNGRRVGYLSALSLLQARDGDQLDYLDVAEAMAAVGSSPAADLRELWMRIVLTVAINNTDDHLRNHGFLRVRDGWRLAPAFDLNPDPEAGERQTSIAGATDSEQSIGMLMEAADTFGLTPTEAKQAAGRVRQAVSQWVRVAAANGIPAAERDRLAEAFRPDIVPTA